MEPMGIAMGMKTKGITRKGNYSRQYSSGGTRESR